MANRAKFVSNIEFRVNLDKNSIKSNKFMSYILELGFIYALQILLYVNIINTNNKNNISNPLHNSDNYICYQNCKININGTFVLISPNTPYIYIRIPK